MSGAGRQLYGMLAELGRISDEQQALTRTFLSPAMAQANARVAAWMRCVGLAVRQDAVGNVIGRIEPDIAQDRPRTLLLGSHLDTVRNAGRFDGALGVLAPLVALQQLRQRGIKLPFAIEVLGFSEEEGVRFSSAYIGSQGYVGQLRQKDLRLVDGAGQSLRETLRVYNGGQFNVPKAAHRARDLLGYCEVHIEQGPVLEAKRLAVGVVTAIAGQTRGRLIWRGRAGHAGTTPMAMRRDALAGAAEHMLVTEAYARVHPPLVATHGTIAVLAGASNVIPGEVVVSLDLRHPVDRDRTKALNRLLRSAQAIARRRGLTCQWEKTQNNGAVTCSPKLTETLATAVRTIQGPAPRLVSGAGHDAVVISTLAPVSMLFVRCRDGLSHHPREHATPGDLGVAVEVLVEFIRRLAVAAD